MAIVGYMRVSTHHQKFDSQENALKNYGVDYLYKERESGLNTSRAVLKQVLQQLKAGDTLVIFKLDRLARGTKQLLSLLEEFQERNIHFVSLQNNIDTTTPMGRFFFTVMGAFAEMEAELIRERVLAGLEAARENGKQLGRPPRKEEISRALELYQQTDLSLKEIASRCQISVPTIYHHLKKHSIKKRQQR